jgi:hypothetical protein
MRKVALLLFRAIVFVVGDRDGRIHSRCARAYALDLLLAVVGGALAATSAFIIRVGNCVVGDRRQIEMKLGRLYRTD